MRSQPTRDRNLLATLLVAATTLALLPYAVFGGEAQPALVGKGTYIEGVAFFGVGVSAPAQALSVEVESEMATRIVFFAPELTEQHQRGVLESVPGLSITRHIKAFYAWGVQLPADQIELLSAREGVKRVAEDAGLTVPPPADEPTAVREAVTEEHEKTEHVPADKEAIAKADEEPGATAQITNKSPMSFAWAPWLGVGLLAVSLGGWLAYRRLNSGGNI